MQIRVHFVNLLSVTDQFHVEKVTPAIDVDFIDTICIKTLCFKYSMHHSYTVLFNCINI